MESKILLEYTYIDIASEPCTGTIYLHIADDLTNIIDEYIVVDKTLQIRDEKNIY